MGVGIFDRLRTAAVGATPRPATPEQRRRRGGNGASSFHLWWDFDIGVGPFDAVTATLEVLVPPPVADLHFWALQVDFVDGSGRSIGGAHTGLQHNRDAPAGGAANWGGYRSGGGGGELDGTPTTLPRVDAGPNTGAYRWRPGSPYRLTIDRGDVGWRSVLDDIDTDTSTVLRELFAPGAVAMSSVVVWSEVFAPCEVRSQVRWSQLGVRDLAGTWHQPRALRPNYQAHSADGCPDTDSAPDPTVAGSVTQTTATPRLHPPDRPITLAAR